MKVHAGMDKDSGLIHSVVVTAANVHGLTPAAELLHAHEEVAYGEAGYRASPSDRRWQSRQRNSRRLCDAANADPCRIQQKAGCRI